MGKKEQDFDFNATQNFALTALTSLCFCNGIQDEKKQQNSLKLKKQKTPLRKMTSLRKNPTIPPKLGNQARLSRKAKPAVMWLRNWKFGPKIIKLEICCRICRNPASTACSCSCTHWRTHLISQLRAKKSGRKWRNPRKKLNFLVSFVFSSSKALRLQTLPQDHTRNFSSISPLRRSLCAARMYRQISQIPPPVILSSKRFSFVKTNSAVKRAKTLFPISSIVNAFAALHIFAGSVIYLEEKLFISKLNRFLVFLQFSGPKN